MDPDSLKIAGVILGVAGARWLVAREERDRQRRREQSAGLLPPDFSPEWSAAYWASHPPGPSLATRLGRIWGRAAARRR
jgi:hypothetical protein